MNAFKPKNYDGPIFLSYKDCQRIHCGLRWDPVPEAIVQTDLDLSYITYDQYGGLVHAASGKDGVKIKEAGSIYHSGDDEDGSDDMDDERVTLNLFSMPRQIDHIFLVAEVSSGQSFSAVREPFIRVSQDASREDMLKVELGGPRGDDEKAFAFIRLERQSGGWMLHYLGDYPGGGDIPDWPTYLTKFLPETADPGKQGIDRPQVPGKGEQVPLFYTKESRHRVICGLSWDAGEARAAYDLDLTCMLFDEQGAYYDYVSTDRVIDGSEAVYHSGDDDSGEGEGDDERISVELLTLPAEIHHVIFIAEAKSDHVLGEIDNPHARIADSMTNRNQLTINLSEGGDKNACILARLVRAGEDWQLHFIGEYIDSRKISNWEEPLLAYVS